jgi:putative transcriptional regulator
MKEDMFNELLNSVKEAGSIRDGKKRAARVTQVEEPDVSSIRTSYQMTQEEFATLLGISTGTLRNWEQGRRKPHGPAKVLLKVAEKSPKAILESLN